MQLAIVNIETNRVQTFVRDEIPARWQPPDGYKIVPESELPDGWHREEPPPKSLRDQIGDMFDAMLAATTDPGERAKLYAAKVTILAAWDRGDMEVVLYQLQTQPLPANLEPYRSSALAMFGDGAS